MRQKILTIRLAEQVVTGESVNTLSFMAFAVTIFLLVSTLFVSTLQAEDLQGSVIAVRGEDISVRMELTGETRPAIGDDVEVIVSLGGGELEMPAGTWKVTDIEGEILLAEATDTVHQPAEKGMRVVVYPAETKASRSGRDVEVPGDGASTPRGTVTMLHGSTVTIALDTAASSETVEQDDMLELFYTIDGEAIKVGTWKVSTVKNDRTVEAEPFNAIGQPSIGYQAIFLPREEKNTPPPVVVSERKKEDTSPPTDTPSDIPKEHIEWQETDVTRDFSQMDQRISCSIGTITVSGRQIEMEARKAEPELHCILPIAEEPLENFSVSFDIKVEGQSFLAGLVFGDLSEPSSDILLLFLGTRTGTVSSGKWWEFKENEYTSAWLDSVYLQKKGKNYIPRSEDFWYSRNGENGENPSPGTLRFIKKGDQCSFFWNGEKLTSGKEKYIKKGRVGIMYKPISDRKGTAEFNNIVIKKLEQ